MNIEPLNNKTQESQATNDEPQTGNSGRSFLSEFGVKVTYGVWD